MRARMGFSSSTAPHANPVWFEYRKDFGNRITAFYQGGNVWKIERWNGGVGDFATITASPFAAGDTLTLVVAWTAGQLSLSVNGSAFASASTSAGVPSGFTSLDFGTFAGTGYEFDSDTLWATGGSGPLTNVDATSLNALGNTDPTTSSLPGTARTTFTWNGVGTAYQTASWSG